MDPTLRDWLELVVRWAHIVTGIAWIGASFYFNWLLNHLTVPKGGGDKIEGELWAIHAGGFFKVEKRRIEAGQLPAPLHWFKWEAYWTWITGFLLLAIIYYLGAGVYLVDANVADITPGTAVAIGIGALVASWFVYDLLWRSPLAKNRPPLAAGISVLLLVGLAFGLSQVLSGRGAYIHVGAVLGTLMAGNVYRVIMPAQRELVAATNEGRSQDRSLSAFAEQRSLHNNYMTLPVLFVMVSNHYPGTYAHEFNWLVLAVLFLAGVLVRYFFNVRHRRGYLASAWALGAAAVVLAGLYLADALERGDGVAAAPDGEDAVAFSTVRAVVTHHCTNCHSERPTHEAFEAPPSGFVLDTPQQIKSGAQRILARAVVTNAMPLGNETGMTQEERDLLANWIYQGAKVD